MPWYVQRQWKSFCQNLVSSPAEYSESVLNKYEKKINKEIIKTEDIKTKVQVELMIISYIFIIC